MHPPMIAPHEKGYSGIHLLIDLTTDAQLTNENNISETIRRSVDAIGATLIQIISYKFSDMGGVTALGILAESHIGLHTWPESRYVSIDIFTCGDLDPSKALPIIIEIYLPSSIEVKTIRRGATLFGYPSHEQEEYGVSK